MIWVNNAAKLVFCEVFAVCALLASVLEECCQREASLKSAHSQYDLDASRATLVGLGFDRLDQRCFAAARLRALRG